MCHQLLLPYIPSPINIVRSDNSIDGAHAQDLHNPASLKLRTNEFIGTQAAYILIRLYHMIFERLELAETLCADVTDSSTSMLACGDLREKSYRLAAHAKLPTCHK